MKPKVSRTPSSSNVRQPRAKPHPGRPHPREGCAARLEAVIGFPSGRAGALVQSSLSAVETHRPSVQANGTACSWRQPPKAYRSLAMASPRR